MISDEMRLKPTRKLPQRQIAGETVLVDARRRTSFLMNGVGGVVWSAIERGETIGEIVTAVVARFRVDQATARADIGKFVDELFAAGLVERS
jgi:hypothetical protein